MLTTIHNDEVTEEMTIEELFADYHGEYRKTVVDWGEPQGKEIW